jgi:hypothetical protein|uniref:Uncharacterized protein n=1 Tax=virus sp. ctoYX9 TaxID=2825822 RepID=A0A8S5RNW6_9VIRU|nr:MAG TPA: hypothetical protein [virus sp. ctoYX9]
MQTNVFLGGADPLLGGPTVTPVDYDRQIAELQQMQQRLEAQRQQQRTQAVSGQTQSQAPIWDEIEKLTAELSDREFDIVNRDEEFQQSQQTIMAILQREQMRLMRPIVEGTQDGKEALENHLALIRQLKKKATKEADRNMELFNEHTQHYSDMTYSEFLQMKNGTAKGSKTSKK